jgi:hypothetical protein
MIVNMSYPASPRGRSSGTSDNADRRAARRSETSRLVAIRVNPDRDGPACSGKLQDVSAGGIGVLTDRAVRIGDTFLIRPFSAGVGLSAVSLLYRTVRCEPRGGRFLIGGVLISAAGDIERDAKGQIAAVELERIRRSMMAA